MYSRLAPGLVYVGRGVGKARRAHALPEYMLAYYIEQSVVSEPIPA